LNHCTLRFNRLASLIVVLLVLTLSGAAQTVPPELFSALQWRLIGPFRGGRVVAVTGVPGDPKTFYFGAVGGGVWKTTDAGTVWKPIFDAEPVASIGAIAVAPSNPQLIYVGTGESDIRSSLSFGDGVYKSTDGGQTWKNIGLHNSRHISRIVVDPANADVVYVAALGHAYGPNDERGIYKSSDGGVTWKQILNKNAETGASDLAIAAGAPNVLFAGMWNARRPVWSSYAPLSGPGSGLYRSTDAGANWTQLAGNGLPDGDWGRVGVAVAPDGERVYALIDAGKKSGLYRSDNGGTTWTLANGDSRLTSRSWYFNWLTVDPGNPDVIYIPNVALYRSEDGGKTVSIVRGAPGGDDYHDLWVDPRDPSHLILGVDQGTTLSLDRGATWTTWYNQPTAQLYHAITDNQFPYQVYGAQQDIGSIAVPSRTDHGLIMAWDAKPVAGGESGYLAPDPKDQNILYATGVYGSVIRYDRRTSLSQDITPWPLPQFGSEINGRKYRATWTPVLVFSPTEKNTLYLGTQFVMKTTDGGLHWARISPDLTGSTTAANQKIVGATTVQNAKERGYGVVFTIAPSPLEAGELWAGTDTGLIHLTKDSGRNWRNVTPAGLSDWSKISLIDASCFDPAEAYAAVDRSRLDDFRPYIYRTRDYGKTWQLINGGIAEQSFARVVREDPNRRGLLYAGTEFGIYVSFDDGDHWQSLQLNLPAASVRDLAIHGNDLVIATHGRSFWILDDITPLRQARVELATALYRPATAVRVDNDSFLGTPIPPDEPTAKNPPDGAILDYYLDTPANQVTLEIFDSDNKLVRRFVSGPAKEQKRSPVPIADRWLPKPPRLETTRGMHRFVWDLRWSTSGDSDDVEEEGFGAPRGPRAVPATYQVKLTVDGKTFNQPLKVEMDPRSSATAPILAQQLRLGLEIFAEARQGRQAAAEIGSVKKRLDSLKPQLAGKPELLSQVSAIEAAMDKIEKGNDDTAGAFMGLQTANTGLGSALRVVESGDRTTPSQALDVYQESAQAMKARTEQWSGLKTSQLAQLNQALTAAGLQAIQVAEIERDREELPGQ